MRIQIDKPGGGSRLLRRSISGRVLGGVAAGFADHFDFDVRYVRLALVLLSFIGGAGVPFYLAAWAWSPRKGPTSPSSTACPLRLAVKAS